jgi:hypothetical protein
MLLYNSTVSGNCYKGRLLFAQLGLSHETREVTGGGQSFPSRKACFSWIFPLISRIF